MTGASAGDSPHGLSGLIIAAGLAPGVYYPAIDCDDPGRIDVRDQDGAVVLIVRITDGKPGVQHGRS